MSTGKTLSLQAGKTTPEIHFDLNSGIFKITGRSFPENSRKFYTPVLDWIKENPYKGDLTIHLNFDYISSSSVIAVMQMLREIELFNTGAKVFWYHEAGDDDMKSVASHFAQLCKLEVNVIEEEN